MATTIVTKNSSTASAVPTAAQLVQGELAVNVADKRLYTENASGVIVEVGTNPSTIDINSGTIDGTVIGGSTAAAGTFTTGQFNTSLNVTGTATMDGLTVDGATLLNNGANSTHLTLTGTTNRGLTISTTNTGGQNDSGAIYDAQDTEGGGIGSHEFRVGGESKLLIAADGDISFYEDTGTTAKLFWDASAESLGIGTSSPSAPLTIGYSGAEAQLLINNSGANRMVYLGAFSANEGIVRLFNSSNVETVRIPAESTAGVHTYFNAGNVGVGTSSPEFPITAYGSSNQVYIGSVTPSVKTVLGSDETNLRAYIGTRTNHPISFVTNGDERMRIDSSGRVGIGTSSPDGILDIEGNFETSKALVLTNTIGTGKVSYIRSHGGNGETLSLYHDGFRRQIWDSNGTTAFESGGSERMRIDSNGNLLVGTTDTSLWNDNADNYGHNILGNGQYYSSTNGEINAYLNRQNSDGAILAFAKDGAPVGSIGTLSGNISIGSGNAGLRFNPPFSEVLPHNVTTNSGTDATVILGSGGVRFKDLYLSGGVYLGGTGAANKLDDYEEGTWTAALTADTGTITLSYDLMRYTKIGRVVTVSGLIICSAVSSPTGDLALTGLPFTVNNNTDGEYSGLSTGSIHIQGLASTITGNPQLDVVNNTTLIVIDGFNGTTRTQISTNISATTQIRICATYTV